MSRSQEPKQTLFKHLALVARTLGSAVRLELIDFLVYCRGPWCVLSFETVARLHTAGLARMYQQGPEFWNNPAAHLARSPLSHNRYDAAGNRPSVRRNLCDARSAAGTFLYRGLWLQFRHSPCFARLPKDSGPW